MLPCVKGMINVVFVVLQSITWAPGKATYLLSASRDYTTRLHAPWKRNGKVTTSS